LDVFSIEAELATNGPRRGSLPLSSSLWSSSWPAGGGCRGCPHMTTHQQDSSQPQQSQDSPQETGLGLTMVEMEEATLAGMMAMGGQGDGRRLVLARQLGQTNSTNQESSRRLPVVRGMGWIGEDGTSWRPCRGGSGSWVDGQRAGGSEASSFIVHVLI